MSSFAQAWRALTRRRTFSSLAIATLGLGIGVTTTAYSIADGVLLRPLPFPDGGQLVSVLEASPGARASASLLAPARLEDWDRLNHTFTALSGSYAENVTDTSGVQPERLQGRRVAPRYFEVFGMAPLTGRTFTADEERFGGAAAAVISEALWTRRYARQPDALGARLIVGGTAVPIVGVMPRAFSTAPIDVWLPAQLSPALLQARDARFLGGIGRMKPGVRVEEARGDLARVQAALAIEFPRTDQDWSVEVRDLKDTRVGEYRQPIALVFGAVALLFAVAVSNVAGLMFVHLFRRAPEFAVRAALGASRSRIVGAVMREVLLLAIAGTVTGTAVAFWLTPVAATALSAIPRIGEIGVDRRALAFAAIAGLVAAVAFGLIPALFASSGRLAPALGSNSRGVAGGRHRLQGAIVVAQLAVGVALAGSAALLLRSYNAIANVDLGFDPGGVLTFHVGAAWDEDRTRVGELQQRLLSELQRLPGVRAAGFASALPATGATLRAEVSVDGLASTGPGGTFTVGQRIVTPGYLRALAVPLVAGSWCAELQADIGAPRVRDVLVNRQFIDRFGSGQDLIGRRLVFSRQRGNAFRIAGVVGDIREDAPAAAPAPYVYSCLPAGSWPDPDYVVRADGDTRALAAAIGGVVRSLDRTRPIFGMKPLLAVTGAALDQPRLNAAALSAFAAAALGLGGLGLHGMMTLLVAQRRRELGVRVALGASRRDVVKVVLASAARLAGAGLGAGLLLALVAGQVLRTMLFGVGPFDPGALATSAVALTLVALLAVLVPLRQAVAVRATEAARP